MTVSKPPPVTGWASPSGLRVECHADGALRSLAFGDIVVNLFVGNALEGGPANLVLRVLGPTVQSVRLLGPRSPTRWHIDGAAGELEGAGEWQGLRYRVALRLAADAPAWFWHVQVENVSVDPLRVDLLLLHKPHVLDGVVHRCLLARAVGGPARVNRSEGTSLRSRETTDEERGTG